jgi:periplasmic divalent cation tolerance protein
MPALIVYCTCPDAGVAARIATSLVERRLAACVNILPAVTSVYRWQDAVEQGSEVLLLIKSEAERYPALQAAIVALHPYELPEILAVETAAGLPAYLDWVRDSTSVTG